MPPPQQVCTPHQAHSPARKFSVWLKSDHSFSLHVGAWIITGGTNAGVMEFVGEAVKDHMLTTGSSKQKVVALGIATWGIVDNKDALTDEDVSSICVK